MDVLRNFGVVLSLGSKNKDKKRNLMLLERLVLESELDDFITEMIEEGQEMPGFDKNAVAEFMNAILGIKQVHRRRENPGDYDIDESKIKE